MSAYARDPGFLEHLRLSPPAVIGSGARFLEFLFTGAPRRRRNPGDEMELLHRRRCRVDVHKETVVACLRRVADGKLTARSGTVPKRFLVSKSAPKLDDMFAETPLVFGQPVIDWGGRKASIGASQCGEMG